MRDIPNTLYVMTQGAYVRLEHETVKVDVEGTTQVQVPLHHLGGIVVFGNVLVSPGVIHQCATNNKFLVMLDQVGRFQARIEGPVSGNVLLRRAQHLALSNAGMTASVAKNIVAGKVKNARQVLLRGARETCDPERQAALKNACGKMAGALERLKECNSLEQVRGIEGETSRIYFEALPHLILVDDQAFCFDARTRRPPRDRVNALLSFLYSLLLTDCVAASESVGLDPQVGFLHALRPGRPALGLDLMEEFRAVLADRVAITLINRKQIRPDDFEVRPGGAVYLNDRGRREVIAAYQRRKREEITHPLLGQKMMMGYVPYVQARVLARVLRGDMEEYLPFICR